MTPTTTWQRQALSNQTTPINTNRDHQETTPIDDHQLTNEYLAVKMQLEMKKRAIERDKQRLETIRDAKRQTISQEAFKQLLQQKTRNTSALTNEFLSSPQSTTNTIRKSQTTFEFRPQTNTPPLQQPILVELKKEETSIVDLSKPMTRDDFLNTLELLKQKYLETTTTTPTVVEENRNDEGHRIEQLNSNIGELQQVITQIFQ
jgi:nucleotidyltransferase/DNA polymerase involved in DNA repair